LFEWGWIFCGIGGNYLVIRLSYIFTLVPLGHYPFLAPIVAFFLSPKFTQNHIHKTRLVPKKGQSYILNFSHYAFFSPFIPPSIHRAVIIIIQVIFARREIVTSREPVPATHATF
jgi:hypothetical protein